MTGTDAITVSWTPPSGGVPTTGYMIYYEHTSGGTDTGSVTVGGASISELTITGRTSDAYIVRIVALSDQIPSTVATTTSSEFTGSVYIYSLQYSCLLVYV